MDVWVLYHDKHIRFTDVVGVKLPGTDGLVCVQVGHAESFLEITAGEMELSRADGTKKMIALVEGEAYVTYDNLVVIQ